MTFRTDQASTPLRAGVAVPSFRPGDLAADRNLVQMAEILAEILDLFHREGNAPLRWGSDVDAIARRLVARFREAIAEADAALRHVRASLRNASSSFRPRRDGKRRSAEIVLLRQHSK